MCYSKINYFSQITGKEIDWPYPALNEAMEDFNNNSQAQTVKSNPKLAQKYQCISSLLEKTSNLQLNYANAVLIFHYKPLNLQDFFLILTAIEYRDQNLVQCFNYSNPPDSYIYLLYTASIDLLKDLTNSTKKYPKEELPENTYSKFHIIYRDQSILLINYGNKIACDYNFDKTKEIKYENLKLRDLPKDFVNEEPDQDNETIVGTDAPFNCATTNSNNNII